MALFINLNLPPVSRMSSGHPLGKRNATHTWTLLKSKDF